MDLPSFPGPTQLPPSLLQATCHALACKNVLVTLYMSFAMPTYPYHLSWYYTTKGTSIANSWAVTFHLVSFPAIFFNTATKQNKQAFSYRLSAMHVRKLAVLYVISCPDPTREERVWWHLTVPSGFNNNVDCFRLRIFQLPTCCWKNNLWLQWEILGYFGTMTQHFFGA